MRDVIITSSILILAILLVRHMAKGRIHPFLQYSLWLLVVLKLLMPIPLWSSQLSVLNLVPHSLDKEYASTGEEIFSQSEMNNLDIRDIWDVQRMQEHMLYGNGIMSDADSLPGKPDAESEFGMSDAGLSSGMSNTDSLSDMSDITLFADMISDLDSMKFTPYLPVFLTLIWFIGIAVTGGYMIFYQIKWQRYLHINKKKLSVSQSEIVSALGIPLSVYTVNGLPSPCLCGRSIYLTEEMAEDEKQLEHILVHEYCHYRQLDSLWVIVRCVLTVIYWFNPLVWAAACISKKDSEFACDAAVIRMLGEDERIPYGKTLINLISGNSYGRSKIGAASLMSDGDNGIRERIFKIARKPKHVAAAATVIILIAAVLIAVTFSGEYKENASGQQTDYATDIISEENIDNLVNSKADEENIEDSANKEADDMQAMSEQLDEAMKQAVNEHEAAIAEELAKIEKMESELSAIKQADAEAEQAESEAEQARLEVQNAEEAAKLEAQNAAESAKMEAAKQALQAEIEAAENESDLSKPLKSEDIQELLLQYEYTALLPHQSAPHISYINPCPSYTRISDTFGKRVHPVTNMEIFHNGVDMAAEYGTDIVAASWGIVCKTGYNSTNGNYVVIYHRDENFTYYAHCSEILVSEGDRVESGQKIAAVGSTGRSTGNHLHFMVSENGEYVEPVFQ